MCGIFAVLTDGSPIDQRALHDALAALHHRGPDGRGLWINKRGDAALGHTRLSLVGIDNGAQPLSNEDNTVHLVVNGEFYEHRAHRRRLEELGHQFRTNSDSEIALHLYEEYGETFLNHLRGEFALILIDQRNHTLLAARDRFGIKPLCYTSIAGKLCLASEMKALLPLGLKPAWDAESMFHATHFQYLLPHRTPLAGVYQLPPGCILKARGTHYRVTSFWDLDSVPTDDLSAAEEETLIDHYRSELAISVTERLQADVPACFLLSGGLDSGAILALATQTIAKPHCFSVGFPGGGDTYDELAKARETARHLGAVHHTVNVTPAEMVASLEDAVRFGEGLAINGHLPAKFLLLKAIRAAGFKIAIGGEGADETLAGYPHLRVDQMRATQQNAGIVPLMQSNPASKGIMLAVGEGLPLDAVRNRLGYVPAFLEAKAGFGFRMRSVMTPDFLADFRTRDAYGDFLDAVSPPQFQTDRVNTSLYLWNKSALCQYILKTLGDGVEMAHGVEGRVPFLDHKLYNLTRVMPSHLKIRNGIEKFPLREAVRPHIPTGLYRRAKHPFIAPPLFADKHTFEPVRDAFGSQAFRDLPFFDSDRVLNLLDRVQACEPETRVYEPVLMTALTVCYLGKAFNLV